MIRDGVRTVEHGGIIYHLNQPACSALLRMLRLAGYPADGSTAFERLTTIGRDTAHELESMELIRWRKVGLAIHARFTPRGLVIANMVKNDEERRRVALRRAGR